MKTAELIQWLSEFPPDSDVIVGESDMLDEMGLIVDSSDGTLPAGETAMNFIAMPTDHNYISY